MIDADEVLKVARLARLQLSDEEIEPMARELSTVLEHIERIGELDLEDVPPTSHPLDVVNVFGADEPRPSLPLDDVFANAPDRDEDYFRSPPA